MKKPNFNEQIKNLTKTIDTHFSNMDDIVKKKCGEKKFKICVFNYDVEFCIHLAAIIRLAKYRVVSCWTKDNLRKMLNMNDIGLYIADPKQTSIGNTLNGNYLPITHPFDENILINQIKEKFGPPVDTRKRDQ